MDDDKKVLKDLESIMAEGDNWIRRHSIMSDATRNMILADLYLELTRLRYAEWVQPKVNDLQYLDFSLYFGFWYLLFHNKQKLIDRAIEIIERYVPDYSLTIRIKRHKKGMPYVR